MSFYLAKRFFILTLVNGSVRLSARSLGVSILTDVGIPDESGEAFLYQARFRR